MQGGNAALLALMLLHVSMPLHVSMLLRIPAATVHRHHEHPHCHALQHLAPPRSALHFQTLRVCLLLYDTPRYPPSAHRERPRYPPECHAIAASLPFCGLLRNNQRVKTQHSMTSCWIKGIKFGLIDDNRWSGNNQIIYQN